MSGSIPTVEDEFRRLDAAILAAHAARDSEILARLYREAGRMVLSSGDTNRAGFIFTQAYVNALEAGDRALAGELWAWLKTEGREA